MWLHLRCSGCRARVGHAKRARVHAVELSAHAVDAVRVLLDLDLVQHDVAAVRVRGEGIGGVRMLGVCGAVRVVVAAKAAAGRLATAGVGGIGAAGARGLRNGVGANSVGARGRAESERREHEKILHFGCCQKRPGERRVCQTALWQK
jgi:hypothetical protein